MAASFKAVGTTSTYSNKFISHYKGKSMRLLISMATPWPSSLVHQLSVCFQFLSYVELLGSTK